jgi:hypothetical protein
VNPNFRQHDSGARSRVVLIRSPHLFAYAVRWFVRHRVITAPTKRRQTSAEFL